MPVVFQLAVHVLLGLGEFLPGNVGEQLVGRPGVDILQGQPGAVLRRRIVRNIGGKLRSVEFVASHLGHHRA